MMLVDTDVFIWLFRGNKKAATTISKLENIALSAVTYMELVQGMRNQKEFVLFRKTIHKYQWKLLPLTENISHRAIVFIENHHLSHSLKMADALIGATAIESGLTLLTGNYKHYKALPDLALVRFRP